ncbi:DUF1178 family protein [uncultured Sphingomonas sp.]|uniref:DUF1178 family protein n=1 Tax=uncultured Sphingomonas sp. TaxID=158754 RepID=UPI0025D4D448|nr:DUF1178 family protein [uncultured Sphingomonas sp.]
MIVFDLACVQGHVFEAWFGSSEDYEDQRRRRLLACPICGTERVEKAVMAPNVAPKGNQRRETLPMRSNTPAPAEIRAMLAALAKAQAKVLEGSEDVGRRFTQEARAMHEGEADRRPIHGQATHAEAKALAADGVPVMPLPLPIVKPEQAH